MSMQDVLNLSPESGLPAREMSPLVCPDACSVPAAITHLKACRDIPLDVTQAIAYLQQLDESHSLHRLYQVYFPLEWACSTANIKRNASGGYSPREEEFLHLVERHLFPLDSDYLIDDATEGGERDRIELLPYANNWWDGEEVDRPWFLLMLLSGMLHVQQVLSQLDELEDLSPSLREAIAAFIVAVGGDYSLQPLFSLCHSVAGPLCHLPVALEMLRYETGNDWLDITGEDGSLPFERLPLRWREQDIDFLTQTFRAAQDTEHQASLFIRWLRIDLDAHLWATLALLKHAYAQQ